MTKKVNGKILNNLWEVGAKHALYHEDGKWYHQLRAFPGALFDARGYIVFESEAEYLDCVYLRIKRDLHIPDGIKSIPGYVKIAEEYYIADFTQQIREVSKQKYKTNDKVSKSQESKIIDAPLASDISHSSKTRRTLSVENRIIRDTKIAKWVKYVHGYRCQICREAIELQNGNLYAEAHHLKPLGEPHNGPDVIENVLCVCPNHHAQLDYGAIEIDKSRLYNVQGHHIGDQYINYHNTVIIEKYSGK